MPKTPVLLIGPSTITRAAKSALDLIEQAPTRAALVDAEERAASRASVRRGGQPVPIIGVSSKEEVAAERARSARQAEIAHARGRKAQEEANPGLIAASTWIVDPRAHAETDPSDRSDYVVPGPTTPPSQRRPDPNPAPTSPEADAYVREMVNRVVNPGAALSTSRPPAVPKRVPDDEPLYVNPAELSTVEKQMIAGVEERECLVDGCRKKFWSATRRFCQIHGFNHGGNLGLKQEK